MGAWWPKSHHIGKAALEDCVIEPKVNGRWYEVDEDGSTCEWGKVLEWDPPRRLLLAWQLNQQFQYDPALVTEVEVRFTLVGPKQTRVEFEHRNLERFGARGPSDCAARWTEAGVRFSTAMRGRPLRPPLERGLGTTVKDERRTDMAKNVAIIYDIYIGANVGEVWKGLVDGEMTKQYVYGTRLEGELTKGSPYAYVGDGSFRVVDGEILDVEPTKRLVMSWNAHWDESAAKDRASRVTYELSAAGPSTTKLHVVHDDFDGETATYTGSVDGWPLMMSSLKSLLETGKPIATQ